MCKFSVTCSKDNSVRPLADQWTWSRTSVTNGPERTQSFPALLSDPEPHLGGQDSPELLGRMHQWPGATLGACWDCFTCSTVICVVTSLHRACSWAALGQSFSVNHPPWAGEAACHLSETWLGWGGRLGTSYPLSRALQLWAPACHIASPRFLDCAWYMLTFNYLSLFIPFV